MSFSDWQYDRGWRGTVWELGRLVLTLARLVLFLVMAALVLWVGISWLAATFFSGGAS